MAKSGQQIDELFISLGLDIAQLQLDFDTAGKNVSQAIQKINSSGNKIKLQMETDLARLDGVGSELDKIRVKYEAINKQLDLQRQKESILAAVHKDAQKNYGADNYVTRKAETDLLRQQKLIAQTEAELRKLQARIAEQGTLQLNIDGEKVKTALKNIQDSVDRTNAKIQNLRLKTAIDKSGLRGVNSTLEAERISAQALNRELDLQQQKLRQLQNAYNVSNKNYGGNNLVTIQAQGNILRQQQEIEKLQAKIREISNTKADIKISANTQQAESYLVQGVNKMKAQVDAGVAKINSSLARIGENAGNKLNTNLLNTAAIQTLTSSVRRVNTELTAVGNYASAGFGKITAGATAAKNAVVGAVDGVNKLNGAILAGTAATMGAAGLFKLSEGAVKAGHDTYLLATRLHTSTGEAGQLKRAFSLVDAEATMVIPIFARLGKQMTNAGENGNALTEAMSNYDFTLTDSAGRMLSYTQMLGELAKGYKNAQEAGETTEFVANVLGARGTNLEPLLANYESLIDASKNVKTTGLLDPQSAEIAYRELKRLEFETGQLKSALGASLLPITRELMPEVVSGFKGMVGFISENKEGLKSFGQIAGDVFGGTARLIGGVIAGLGDLKNAMGDISGSTDAEKILKNAGLDDYLKKGNTTGMILGGMLGSRFGAQGAIVGGIAGGELGEEIYSLVGKNYLKLTGEWDYYQQKDQLMEQEKKAWEDLKKIRAELGDDWDETGDLTARQKRVAEIQKNLEFEMATATSQRLKDKIADIEETTKQSIEAGAKEATAWKKAEKEIAKAIKETRAEAEKANEELKQSIYELQHNDLQNKFDKVDVQAEEMLNRGADADLVNQNAELQRKKIQEEFDRDILSKVNATYKTDLQNKLDAIEQEKQAYIQKGLEEVEANKWAESEKAKTIRDFNNEVAANLDSIYQTELEKRLAQIEREKQAWIQKGVEEAKATQAAEKLKEEARNKLNDEFNKQQEALLPNDFERKLAQIEREKKEWIKKGIDESQATKLAEQQKVKAYKDQQDKLNAIRRSTTAEFKTDLQNRLDSIEAEKQQWIKTGMSVAEATELAERKKAKTIEDLNKEAAEKFNSIWKTELENRLDQIEKERNAWIKKGVDEVAATKWAEQEKANASRNAAISVLKQEYEAYKAFMYPKMGDSPYDSLKKYYKQQLIKAGVDEKDLNMNPAQLNAFLQAKKVAESSLLPNFMTYADKDRERSWQIDTNFRPWMDSKVEGYWQEYWANNGFKQHEQFSFVNDSFSDLTKQSDKLEQSFSDLKTIVDSLALLPNGGIANPSSQGAQQNFIKQGDQQPQNYSDLGQVSMPYQSEKITKYWEPTSLTFDDALKRLSQVPPYTPVDFDKGSVIRGEHHGDVYGTSNLITNDITKFKQHLSEDFFTTNSTALNGFNQQTQAITEKLANLGAAIENIALTPDKNLTQTYSDSGRQQQQPQQITNHVTVQIDEAHAWDSEHIQELTEKVADKITPALEQALGGDSNSY